MATEERDALAASLEEALERIRLLERHTREQDAQIRYVECKRDPPGYNNYELNYSLLFLECLPMKLHNWNFEFLTCFLKTRTWGIYLKKNDGLDSM